MSLELLIYLADVSENMALLMLIFGIIFSIGSMFCFAAFMENDLKNWQWLAGFLILSCICLSGKILLPTKPTIYSIAAIKMGKEISKNEKVIETSDKIYKLLNQKLDEILEVKK